jgi:hypothetical protein
MQARTLRVLSFLTIAGGACSSSQQRPDASGSGGSSGGACHATEQSFPATPVDPDAGAQPCTFMLPPRGPNYDSAHIAVSDGSAAIPKDTSHQNGWDYVDPTQTQIQIWGPTCDAIMAGTVHTVCIEFLLISDRDAKRDFTPVDRDAILERVSRLPISTWSYRSDAGRTRHIGPMAQDFKLSFDVGASDKTIHPLDESGVAFAAIQALDLKIKRLEEENARLQKQIDALRAHARAR